MILVENKQKMSLNQKWTKNCFYPNLDEKKMVEKWLRTRVKANGMLNRFKRSPDIIITITAW